MATSKEVYKDYSRFYDDYTDDVTSDFDVYTKNIKKEDSILEIGCGTGRITEKILQKEPMHVIGVDTSIDMLKIAKKKLEKYVRSKKLTLLEHDFSLNILNYKYNKIYITYFTINYIIENLNTFITNASYNLDENGEIIIDCFVPDSIIEPNINNVERSFDAFYSNNSLYYVTDKRILENNLETRIVVFDNKINDKVYMETKRRYYTIEEMIKLLETVGYNDIKWNYGYNYPNETLCRNFLIKARKVR